MKIKILCSVLLILLAVACTTMPESQIDDLKAKILQANMDVGSFKFKSISNMDVQKQEEAIVMDMEADGAFDRDAKKFSVLGIVKMGDMTMPIKTYCDGGWVYTETMGQWMKIQLASPEMFEQQDQAKYMLEFMETSEINAEETIVDGEPYYKVHIIPDMAKVLEMAEKNSPMPLDTGLGELKDIFKNMEITYYVNKETLIADKFDMKYELVLEDAVMKVDTEYEMFEINQPQNIIIPEEAQTAMDFTEMQAQMAQTQQAQPDSDFEVIGDESE